MKRTALLVAIPLALGVAASPAFAHAPKVPVVTKAHHSNVVDRLKLERKVHKREVRSLKAQLRAKYQGDALAAIKFGSIVTGFPYRQGVALVRCETGNTFSPFARNPTSLAGSNATGLWQFLYHPQGIRSSTWHHGTRYAAFSPYNMWVQSVAAGEYWKLMGRSWDNAWKDICGKIADRT